MRIKNWILSCALQLIWVFSAQAQMQYGNVIKVNAKTYAMFSGVINDLQLQLSQSTGATFTIDSKDSLPKNGIQIIRLDDSLDVNYDKRLDPANSDAVLIQSDGENYIKIVSYGYQGIINGIYSYLDTLGFRWYHPGNEWACIPKLKDIRIKCDEVLVPDFALRTFFGTWGTPRNRVVDPKAVVDNAWNEWSTRNRLGGAYILKGHSWNEFLWRNYSPLNDHREMMALVNGTRVAPATAAKFCVSNKDFQALFVKDMVIQLTTAMKKSPGQSRYCISVEPSDGPGFCECSECAKLGGISNEVFLLANLVAKEFQKISPKAFVNLYAYNTHAAPPDFALEPNVLVQIIPYGYQHYSSPQEMIEDWKKKDDKLFIYDYYGLPINNIDMPLKGDLKPLEFANRLKYWHDQHIIGATLESSYSIGATGDGLYLFARLAWNINSNPAKLLDEYSKFCFGKASDAVQRAEVLLTSDTIEKTCALARSQQIIQKAAKLKLDERQKICLTDFKAYTHYLKLLYDVQLEDSKIEPTASDNLMQFVYGIFQTMMVHQFPVNEYLKTHGPAKEYINQYWDGFKPTNAGMKFASVKQLTTEQIDAIFDDDCKQIKD